MVFGITYVFYDLKKFPDPGKITTTFGTEKSSTRFCFLFFGCVLRRVQSLRTDPVPSLSLSNWLIILVHELDYVERHSFTKIPNN